LRRVVGEEMSEAFSKELKKLAQGSVVAPREGPENIEKGRQGRKIFFRFTEGISWVLQRDSTSAWTRTERSRFYAVLEGGVGNEEIWASLIWPSTLAITEVKRLGDSSKGPWRES